MIIAKYLCIMKWYPRVEGNANVANVLGTDNAPGVQWHNIPLIGQVLDANVGPVFQNAKC